MFTLLLVLAGLAAWLILSILLGLLLGRAIRRGEQQARRARAARHAATPTPSWARTDHGEPR
ncbi:hypothetical protein ACFWBI_08940 [Streptomyces sp. NPDC059982]|uniref:hypothetical protein n=1 Tax=unclassified Streptomyces TaxID=2593676 RepID=UPI00367426ED